MTAIDREAVADFTGFSDRLEVGFPELMRHPFVPLCRTAKSLRLTAFF